MDPNQDQDQEQDQEQETMATARARYFEVNDFGADGGYNDAWVDFKLGPVTFPFPNTPGRLRAVGYHDLHHVVTGYATDLVGEAEISAWEVAAGCRGFPTALALDLSGMVLGLLLAPARTFRAFVRGRRNRSLYGRPMNDLLAAAVGTVRRDIGADGLPPQATAGDKLTFVTALGAGVVVGGLLLAGALVALPFGLVAGRLRRRKP